MTCSEASGLLERYIDGELSGELRRPFENHVENCPDCRQRMQMLQDVDELGRMDFYRDPGEAYWSSVTARIMDGLPNGRPQVRTWDGIRSWFESPAFLRRAAYAAAAAVLIFAGVRFGGNLFDSGVPENLAVNREASLSEEPQERHIGENVSREASPAPEKPAGEEAEQSGKRTGGNTGSSAAGDSDSETVPYVPKQMTVAPKPPTADNNPPAVEDPFKTGNKTAVKSKPQIKEEKAEEFAASPELQAVPPIRNPRIPGQSLSAYDRNGNGVQGYAAFQQGVRTYRGSRSSTRLSDYNQQNEVKKKGVSASSISDAELFQNKIILLEVLQTGKDRKIRDVALIQLDGIYQKLFARNPSDETVREIKGFYSVYRDNLVKILGREEYDRRIETIP